MLLTSLQGINFSLLELFGNEWKIGVHMGKYIPFNLEINEDIGKWCGFYVIEGCAEMNKNKDNSFSSRVSYCNFNQDWMNELDIISEQIFQSKITHTINQPSNVLNSSVNTKIAYFITRYVFHIGNNSRSKCVPSFIYKSNNDVKKAFIQWYWNGDGSYTWNKKNNLNFRTNSDYLVNGIILLLNQLGYENITLYTEKNGMHTIRINGENPLNDEKNEITKNFCEVVPISIAKNVPELIQYIPSDVNRKTIQKKLCMNVLIEAKSKKAKKLYELLIKGYRFDFVKSNAIIPTTEFVYDASVNSKSELYIAGFGNLLSHNSLYGYLKSMGARFWSIEAAGATCLKGQEIIDFAIRLSDEKMCGINIEVDSLDYNERLVFLDSQGCIRVMKIGEFFDMCYDTHGIYNINTLKSVDYVNTINDWKVLSSDKHGIISWKDVKVQLDKKLIAMYMKF
jgi:DNA polymerase elongation subunit (family B)